jgi:hypothetical protein
MKKQFEIIDTLHTLTKQFSEKVSTLNMELAKEFENIKKEVVKTYSNNDIMFLVEFNDHGLNFFKLTNNWVSQISFDWYGWNEGGTETQSTIYVTNKYSNTYKKPKSFEEAEYVLSEYKNPSNCSIRGKADEFGYFHDVQKFIGKSDWITEKISNREFLYEITKKDFLRAVDIMSEFYKK